MLIPLLSMNIAINLGAEDKLIDVLIGTALYTGIILWLIAIPICYITQIVTLILKLIEHNKTKKDYILIVINIVTLILFGFIILFILLISRTI